MKRKAIITATVITLALFCFVPLANAAGLSVSNVNINSEGVTVGTPIKVKLTVGALLTTHYYQIQLGLIRGNYPNPGNGTSVCTAMREGENTAEYYASQRDIVTYTPNGNATFGRSSYNSGSESNVEQNSNFEVTLTPDSVAGDIRLYAILFDRGDYNLGIMDTPTGDDDWCRNIKVVAAKHYIFAENKVVPDPADPADPASGGGGGAGGGGGISYPDITIGDVSGQGIFGVTNPDDSTAGSPTCTTDLTINLPVNRGQISLGGAGILGLCSPRPVLFRIIEILLTIAYIFFVVAIIYSGIILATADSDEKAVTAKKNLTWAAIGALVVIAANWIVPAVINIITAATP